MEQSTLTERFQTTIPLGVRRALGLSPRQKVTYEVRDDGSAILRPGPTFDELFGSLKLNGPLLSPAEEKRAAREAMARRAASVGRK